MRIGKLMWSLNANYFPTCLINKLDSLRLRWYTTIQFCDCSALSDRFNIFTPCFITFPSFSTNTTLTFVMH